MPLLLVLGLSFNEASTISLFIMAIGSLSATTKYHQQKRIDWRLLLLIEPLTLGMAFLAGFLAYRIDASSLKIIFAITLVISSLLMLRSTEGDESAANGQARKGWKWNSPRIALIMPVTALAGGISGLVGIAGGVFKIPAMVLLGRVPMHTAVGTSAPMITLTTTAGMLGHLTATRYEFEIWAAIALGIAAIFGGQIGPRLSTRMKSIALRRLFTLILFPIAVWMIVSSVG